jgi:hypothetical protein
VKSEYSVKVTATDHGVPNNLSSSLTLTVRVRDVNDQPPMFDRNVLATPHPVSFNENQTSQACQNLSVAKDNDSNVNFTIICYYLVGEWYMVVVVGVLEVVMLVLMVVLLFVVMVVVI